MDNNNKYNFLIVPPEKPNVSAIMAQKLCAGILAVETRVNPYLPDGIWALMSENHIDVFDGNKGTHFHIERPEIPGLIKKFNVNNA